MMLVGYKAIAEYLGVSKNTVWRWTRTHGFPVGYYPSGKRVISTDRVDAWIETRRVLIQGSKEVLNGNQLR